jgi:hypothetical protein
MKTILKLLTAPLLFLCVLVQAQVKTNFNNKTLIDESGHFSKPYKATIDFEIPSKNITNLLQAEKSKTDTNQETKPFQIAVPVPVNLDIAKLMNWDYEGDSAYGKFTIKVNGALSSSINFDKFYLPNETEMYIYNENGKIITGPITEKENNPDKTWGSWVYQGPRLTIEIKTPLSTLNQLMLHANNIAYGYKAVYVSGFGQSSTCEINVLCPLGNGWQNERNSVALGISGDGTVLFSGSMIMNTCNTNRPFFLTANHVYEEATPVRNVTGWRFTFQALSPTCTPSQNSNGVTYNGSVFRANWAGSDFCLVELNSTPPANSGINYSGWSRANVAPPSGVSISHPMGDVMKIASFNQPPTQQTFLGSNDWNVVWANGTVEPGSSGGPLYNNDHRIVGQVHGGSPSTICNVNDNAFFGRFDLSWTGGGTNSTRLSNWLDPNNSGAMTTNTTNVSTLVPFIGVLSISGSDAVCSTTSQYTLNNNGIPATGNITWVSSNSNIATVTAIGNPATVTKTGNGKVTITATLSACDGIKSISKTLVVGIPDNSTFKVYQDPFCNGNTISFGAYSGSTFDNCSLWNMGVTNITWDIPSYCCSFQITNNSGPGVCANGSNNSGIQVYFSNTYIYNAPYIRFKAQNACGWSDWMLRPVPVSFQACGSWSFSASPNPANSSLDVALNEEEQPIKTDNSMTIQEIQITDKLGNVVKQVKYSTKVSKVTLDISSLKQDVYFVRVYNGNEWKTEAISKQ